MSDQLLILSMIRSEKKLSLYIVLFFSNTFIYSYKFGRGRSSSTVWNLQPLFIYSGNPFSVNPVVNNHYRDVGVVCGKVCKRYKLRNKSCKSRFQNV